MLERCARGVTFCHAVCVLLAYVDERYTRDRNYMVWLPRVLDEKVVEPSRVYGIAPPAELHGTDLLPGNRGEPIKKMPHPRIGAHYAAIPALADHEAPADPAPRMPPGDGAR